MENPGPPKPVNESKPQSALPRQVKQMRRNGAPRHPSFAAVDAFEVMAGTGLRIGEVLSLRPADLAFDAEIPTLTVTGTLTEVAGAGGVQRQPFRKSDDSVRTVALPVFVVRALRRQMELNGSPDLVFTTGTGRCISPGNIRRARREARRGSELEWVTPHTMRRSVATILSEAVDIEAAAGQLGHSDPRVTAAHYLQ